MQDFTGVAEQGKNEKSSFLTKTKLKKTPLRNKMWILEDIPGGPVVKNLPCNAGGTGSISGQGTKIPCAAEQLGAWATAKGSVSQWKTPHGPNKEIKYF